MSNRLTKKIRQHRLIDEEWVQIAIADMEKDIMTVRNACYNFAISVDTLHIMKMFENATTKATLKLTPRKVLLSETLEELIGKKPVSDAIKKYKDGMITDELIEDFIIKGSAVKVAGTDLAMRTCSRVADIVGLEGMSNKYGIEKCFRDAKVMQIYEGTNQANLIDLYHGGICKEAGI